MHCRVLSPWAHTTSNSSRSQKGETAWLAHFVTTFHVECCFSVPFSLFQRLLPVVATMTFGPLGGKQFPNTGGEIDRAARKLQEAGACGLGANCGTGPEPLVEIIRIFRSATRLPIVVQPSCGVPRQEAGKLLFPVDPEDMARFIADFVQAGATWIGGCCGTTETHIRAMAREVGRVQLLP